MKEAFLGIDISKLTFDVALLEEDKVKSKKFTNNKQGFKKLTGWLDTKNVCIIHACMEVTGVYGEHLAEYLFLNKIPVSIVNPARIKGFSQSELSRAKNDELDAKLIARFCKLIRPKLWEPTPDKIKFLQQWVRRLDDLIKLQRQEENRLEAASDYMKPYIEKTVKHISNQIKEAKKIINEHIDNNPELKEKSELLKSIPGIGEATTAQVLAFIGDTGKFRNAKEVAAFVGLNPKQNQSGTSVRGRTRLSKTGDATLRKALYMPAIVSMRHNPVIRQFASRLESSGKHKMAIIGAIMRKLIHIIYGVLKNKNAFNAELNC